MPRLLGQGQPQYPPSFDGVTTLFGSPNLYTMTPLYISPLQTAIDKFLGRTPGTTKYGASPGGRVFGISGTFVGPTPISVQQQQAQLMSYAGISATFGSPINQMWPGGYYNYKNCVFRTPDIVFGPTVAYLGNQAASAYLMVIRQSSNN
jgi:hypothetical protein